MNYRLNLTLMYCQNKRHVLPQRKSVKRPIEKPTHSRKLEEIDPKLSDRDIIVRDLKFKKPY